MVLTFVQSFLLVWGREVFRRWSTGWRLEREKKRFRQIEGGEKTFGESRARSLGLRVHQAKLAGNISSRNRASTLSHPKGTLLRPLGRSVHLVLHDCANTLGFQLFFLQHVPQPPMPTVLYCMCLPKILKLANKVLRLKLQFYAHLH